MSPPTLSVFGFSIFLFASATYETKHASNSHLASLLLKGLIIAGMQSLSTPNLEAIGGRT
ncbi:protein of unknown function [Methylocaldum szegediense]|uniref:Uncharacterized protein n=1 Tax=Methylocaldum szegediense TaxID=73780 RepID=A0ABN8XA92_9GAMM|nr:protein of unknown function [Methylocaldum szegediense]